MILKRIFKQVFIAQYEYFKKLNSLEYLVFLFNYKTAYQAAERVVA